VVPHSVWLPPTTEVFRGFPQSFQANGVTFGSIRPRSPPYGSLFTFDTIFHSHPTLIT